MKTCLFYILCLQVQASVSDLLLDVELFGFRIWMWRTGWVPVLVGLLLPVLCVVVLYKVLGHARCCTVLGVVKKVAEALWRLLVILDENVKQALKSVVIWSLKKLWKLVTYIFRFQTNDVRQFEDETFIV